jgi:hypothetical protein
MAVSAWKLSFYSCDDFPRLGENVPGHPITQTNRLSYLKSFTPPSMGDGTTPSGAGRFSGKVTLNRSAAQARGRLTTDYTSHGAIAITGALLDSPLTVITRGYSPAAKSGTVKFA